MDPHDNIRNQNNEDMDVDVDEVEDDDDDEEDDDEEDDMGLTEEEYAWALELKEIVDKSPHLEPLPDFEIVHHAIAANGDLNRALQQVQGMQSFVQYYKIDSKEDDIARGLRVLNDLNTLCPNWLLSTRIIPKTGGGELVWDQSLLKPSAVYQRHMDYNLIVLAHYYVCNAVQPTFESIREGVTILTDGALMTWELMDMNYQQQLYDEFGAYFPHKIKQMRVYNANGAAVQFWNLVKRVIPKQSRDAFVLDKTLDVMAYGRRSLSELFLQPSPDASWKRFMQDQEKLMQWRLQNIRTFEL